MTRPNFTLLVLGAASWLAYLAALGLRDLRADTLGFEVAFFAAFSLYLAAVAVALRARTSTWPASRLTLPLIFFFAVLFRLTLLPMRPTLSDDMFRYVWDGRVQAHGLNPYRYAPEADELADLRRGDGQVWPSINRKGSVTVYPPGAQLVFAGVWRVVGDSVTGFKTAFVLAELVGGVLLLRLLRLFGQPAERSLIYLWSPLLVFEVAHAGHLDGLMLPLLIVALWACVTERHRLLGISLGAATLVKLFPGLLLPALLPLPRPLTRNGMRGSLEMLAAFGGTILVGYLPYLLGGASPLGFLPLYFRENFNLGLARGLFDLAQFLGLPRHMLANWVTFGGLAMLALVFGLRPAASGREALWRCVWLIGWFTLFTQNLFPWYLLWLLPLLVLFVEPGKLLGLRLAPMSAWLIFTGTAMLAYLFFIRWRVIPWAQVAEYAPLYILLLLSLVGRAWPAASRYVRSKAPVAPAAFERAGLRARQSEQSEWARSAPGGHAPAPASTDKGR